jgi:hypothetical protein
MYGLVLMIRMFTADFGDKGQKYGFKVFGIVIDACVPEEKKARVEEQLEDLQKTMWSDIGKDALSGIYRASWTF